jgi:hypothetical protein
LLEGQADCGAELFLAQAKQCAAETNAGTDMDVDRAWRVDFRSSAAAFAVSCLGLHPKPPSEKIFGIL